MAKKFPNDAHESLGQFQVATSEGTFEGPMRTGTLRFSGTRIELEVSPEITPSVEWRQLENGSWVGESPKTEKADLTLLGNLAITPSAVSLWKVNTTRRRTIGMTRPGTDTPGNQEMQVDWCITGAHIPDPGTTFPKAYLDITNLHEWAEKSYVTQTISLETKNGLPQTWTLDFPTPETVPLVGVAGTLTLTPQASASPPSATGFRVSTNTRAMFQLTDGVTLSELVTNYAQPLTSLMTLLSGVESSLRGIELRDANDDSMHAYGHPVRREAPQSAGDLFLRRSDVEADLLRGWINTAKQLAPVPQILASIWAGSMQTVETEALTLATTTEALHRMLHPGSRRFTEEEIDESLAGLSTADMPQPVKASLEGALKQYWSEKSYPQRIEELAQPVKDAVPSCVGKLNRWKREVTDLRISLAHGFSDQNRTENDVHRIFTLTRSVRWMLTFRVLLNSGVTPTELGKAAQRSERYNRDVRRWDEDWPNIFKNEC